ncbi:acyl-ACP thioesterase [Breznakiella homolactica]|uniref:Acyl-ACP thioesterase n=1 Tax=Breznakiella homolactica TaxID=2798577 RepID=A0A7T7XRT9_9SPIR|nr:acyl-ACP thioesterase [Breznakiella homolactica]
MDIWQESFPMRFWDVDKTDRLTLSGTFDFFQEVAIAHAEHLGVGREALERTGQAWILSRMSVMLERRPRLGEPIKVRTWPRGAEKLFAVRDYDIRDESDIPVVKGRSGWVVLDVAKKRPLRPQSVMENMPKNEGIDSLPDGARGLDVIEGLSKKTERNAAYSDIDYNGHVNNARYVQWIQDILDPELLYAARQMRLDINYISEILPGETSEIWAGPAGDKPDTIAVEGRHQDSGLVAFRAELWTGA